MSVNMSTRHVVGAHEIHPKTAISGHAVQFYESDSGLFEVVGQHIGSALVSGDTAMVVATKAHRLGLAEELRTRTIDVTAVIRAGRYIELDAAETLAKFMADGWPDAQKFTDTIGPLVARVQASMTAGRRVVIFGEMVALLWAEGKRDATIHLEELWNDLAERHSFLLLCGYPITAFDRLEHRRLFFNICGEHSVVNPAESYPAQGSEKQRRRSVVRLQQQAHALQTEIRLSQERIRLLQNVTNAGSWEMDLVDEIFFFSSTGAKLLGLQSGHVPIGKLLNLMYYSGDRDTVLSGLQHARKGRKEFAATFRVLQGEQIRVLEIRGKTIYNSGCPLILGVLLDVTPPQDTL